jgi:hypothetical protein
MFLALSEEENWFSECRKAVRLAVPEQLVFIHVTSEYLTVYPP